MAYRRPWAHLCALHGLTATLNDTVLVPALHQVRIGPSTDTVTVGMLYGQTVDDWAARSDALAHAFGALWVRTRALGPRWVALDVHHRDTLGDPIPLSIPAADDSVDLEQIAVGVTETGQPWVVRVLGRHILIAGATGAGKGSVIWSTLAGLGPAVVDGSVQVWAVDPKGGMELGAGQAMFSRFAYDTGTTTLGLLRDAADILTDRADRLRGVTRLHTPTVTEPLIVVVIDEIATLTAYVGDRKARTEIDQLLGLLLSQGRAVGVSVIAAVQDPSKDVLAMRQLFPTRIGLRLTEPSQVSMVLGDGARDRGGRCDQVPDTLPGVGYIAYDGTTDLVKVRAFWVTDADIDHLAARYRPPNRSHTDDDTAGPQLGES
jgi:S-DNA-T family DNA segregation ATPase FtsK/SpoIIIE